MLFLCGCLTCMTFGKDFSGLVSVNKSLSSDSRAVRQALRNRHLVAFWDFSEEEGCAKRDKSQNGFILQEYGNTPIPVVEEGPVSGRSVRLDGASYFAIPYRQSGKLNVRTNEVTVIAWVKWSGEQTGFVAGMWNEYQDGGKRQYGLFVSLPHYNGKNQVCGHISQSGKATPPFPYSIDYSASQQEVPPGEWCCVAFSYDGAYIRSYLDGVCIPRAPELILHTKGFKGYPDGLVQSKNPYYFPDGIGDNGSDFTVGAVSLKNGMGNFFIGCIGGVAVYDKALSADEIANISRLFTPSRQ